jgi:hypothetical protein
VNAARHNTKALASSENILMTGIRPHTGRRLSLSVTGILAVVLLVGPACVPQQLRADVVSRIKGFAQVVDTQLAGAWRTAFRSQRSDNQANASASRHGGASHLSASLALPRGENAPSMAVVAGLDDPSGPAAGSFSAQYGAGSARNSVASLIGDRLTDDNFGIGDDHDVFAGDRDNFGSSRDAGEFVSGGTGSSDDRTEAVAVPRSTSTQGTAAGSARSQNSGGRFAVTRSRPDTDADQVADLGGGLMSGYEDAGPSRDQVTATESLNNLLGDTLTAGDSTVRGGDGYAFSTTDSPLGSSQNGHFTLQATGAAGSAGHPGPPSALDSTIANDPHVADLGSVGNAEPITAVPEPRSLVLLSLGLGGVLLWRKFGPVR